MSKTAYLGPVRRKIFACSRRHSPYYKARSNWTERVRSALLRDAPWELRPATAFDKETLCVSELSRVAMVTVYVDNSEVEETRKIPRTTLLDLTANFGEKKTPQKSETDKKRTQR